MSDYLKKFSNRHKGFMKRSKSLISSGDWQLKKNKGKFEKNTENFLHENRSSLQVVERLSAFIKGADGERQIKSVQNYIEEVVEIINLHLNRVEKYYSLNDPDDWTHSEKKKKEEIFQQVIFKGQNTIQEKLDKLNISNNYENIEINFHSNRIASIPFREVLQEFSLDIKEKISSVGIDWTEIQDKRFYISIPKKEIPKWNPRKHFFDQDLNTLKFFASEWNKIKHGYEVDGYSIHPFFYWHLNYFKTNIPQKNDRGIIEEKIQRPLLRRNEWYFCEILKKAEELNRGAIFIFGSRRIGKALRDDQILYKTDGTTQYIGKSKIGDSIFGSDGKPTKITGVFPQGEKKLYKIKLADGRESICCDEHLWTVYDKQAKREKVLPLKELLNCRWKYNRFAHGKNQTVFNFSLPVGKGVEYKDDKYEIDPYFLGLWLGDGLSKTSAIISEDDFIKNYIINYGESLGMSYREEQHNNNTSTIFLKTEKNKQNPLLNILRDKNLINNKHLPKEIYLKSKKFRLSVIKGMMDTDGYINKSGDGISFCSANKNLANDFMKLCRSIGIHCKIFYKVGNYVKINKQLNEFYEVCLYTKEIVFKLPRKSKRQKNKNLLNYKYVNIIDIIEEKSSNATCIMVDNMSKEFLTNDYIVTHNSVLEASYLAWKSLVSPNAETSVTISNDEDRVSIVSKIQDCYKHLHPAFKPTTNKDDWENLVELGLKVKATNEKIKHCNIRITNLASGAKKSTQKGAGGAPVAYIYDESGKASFIDAYNAAKYSFKTPDGWKTIPIFTGTGSNVDISKDAELVLNNPKKYDFLEMDWDLLEYKIPKEAITWERRTFGHFMPGQMSYEEGLKFKKTTLSDFLGLKSEVLSKIDFNDADWVYNSNLLLNNQKKLKKEDRKEYQAYCVYLPTDPEHCLMSAKNNPFQPDKAKVHKTRLETEGSPKIGIGRPVEMYRDTKDPTKIRYRLSNKDLPDFPHKGGNIDAPFILFDDFPEEKPVPDRFIASFDDYKHEKSDGDSIGSFGIFDRLKRKLVLTLGTRPEPHSDLHVQIHMALDAFNAKAFPENADLSFVTYLKNKKILISNYLEPSFDMYSEFSRYTSNNRNWGWTPNKDTTPRVMAFVVNYAVEVIDILNEEGEVIGTKIGLENIPDPMVIEEMIKYKDTGNYDRLIMLGGILLYDHYLTYNHRVPKSFDYNKRTEKKEEKKPVKNKYFRKGRDIWRN